ncbi:MAG: hypothetical protein M1814_004924 [Vezdaea aestivalis]|nr:MAG: hypothetical protein M1814_004924 [Vezdaea aestivalis]
MPSPPSSPTDPRRSRADPALPIPRSTALSRSPHPYHRHGGASKDSKGATPRPAEKSTTPSIEDSTFQWHRPSTSPDDSGTEADDEGFTVLRSLPAPPLRPRKGLRDAKGSSEDGVGSPLRTPDASERTGKGEGRIIKQNGWESRVEERRLAERVYRRRRAEIARRVVEAALAAGIGVVVLCGQGVWSVAWRGHKVELVTHLVITLVLGALYLVRLVYWSWTYSVSPPRPLRKRIRLPTSFDPAPLLYPTFLPIHVALSLLPSQRKLIVPNIILSLSSLPPGVIPAFGKPLGFNLAHWVISTIPFSNAETLMDREKIVLLFPLHQALSPVLYYLTTTSLLPAELKLLSTALVNLLIHSTSPQSVILKASLWGGGVSTFILCGHVLRWGVALARVPRWRFRRASTVITANNILLRALEGAGNISNLGGAKQTIESDADEDEPVVSLNLKQRREERRPRNNSIGSLVVPGELRATVENYGSALTAKLGMSLPRPPRRRNTLPVSVEPREKDSSRSRSRKERSSAMQTYLNMTPLQAKAHKWGYALYVYTAVLGIVLVGLRGYVAMFALRGMDPFGWALGYAFGDVSPFRLWVVSNNLERWIALPDRASTAACRHRSLACIRQSTFGSANSRLVICGYCALVLTFGLFIVSQLSRVLEVDTRRKVFHGMMVVMFLPTIVIDPLFTSLALSLILALFLLLDLFRASQLPPLSIPISHFLAPYVDGRDLRGPVVVSHIFLLIGCAIPVWLSLAAVPRTSAGPWAGWEVQSRDVSMIAGVVCVGMGDAAASLVGRRYGRHKWFWSGGKSLEGSAAFAVAVAVGLSLGKGWGILGGWLEWGGGFGAGRMLVAGAGASLMEAVLTGGNDNVIVPVVLWLFVRGLRI